MVSLWSQSQLYKTLYFSPSSSLFIHILSPLASISSQKFLDPIQYTPQPAHYAILFTHHAPCQHPYAPYFPFFNPSLDRIPQTNPRHQDGRALPWHARLLPLPASSSLSRRRMAILPTHLRPQGPPQWKCQSQDPAQGVFGKRRSACLSMSSLCPKVRKSGMNGLLNSSGGIWIYSPELQAMLRLSSQRCSPPKLNLNMCVGFLT